mgnify:CR=1 FL=1
MKQFLILFLTLSPWITYSETGDCEWGKNLLKLQHDDFITREQICTGLAKIETQKELEDAMEFFYWEARRDMGHETDRHKINKLVNKCEPTKNSRALIIAFEGTGAYDPLIPAAMARFNKCLGGKISPKLRDSIYHSTTAIYKTKRGKGAKWSGLNRGVMSETITIKNSRYVDWYSFPSEESEVLAGLEEAKDVNSWKRILKDSKNSLQSNPMGISNARNCVSHYLAKAKELNIKPKIVLTSHSSGGRSLVKFSEHLKKAGIQVDLAFSIDPVVEAHHALEEVIPQIIGEPARNKEYWTKKISNEKFGTSWHLPEYSFSAVWTRNTEHKNKLYKPTNVKEHINFYQTVDRKGLDVGGDAGRFGIRGTQMDGAQNRHIEFKTYGEQWGGHGEINTNGEVLSTWHKEMDKIIGND